MVAMLNSLSYLRSRIRHIGAPPGELNTEHPGDAEFEPMQVRVIRYSATDFNSSKLKTDLELPSIDQQSVLWIDLIGYRDTGRLVEIARHFQIPDLVIEDATDVGQRPLFASGNDWSFLSLRRVWQGTDDELKREQLGLFLKRNLVVTFQEYEGDAWDPIRNRIKMKTSKLRENDAAYLWYRLIDATVDSYYLVMDRIANRLEAVEDEIFGELTHDIPRRLGRIRKETVALRRAVWPLREALEQIPRDTNDLINEQTIRLFADTIDHSTQISEVNEVLRESVKANMDTYVSLVSLSQNEIMRVLTLVATIFIPLTFIVGVYGMNFKQMPELNSPWGYPLVWTVMVVITGIMLALFRRKRWL
jgi:magnesium transporter